MSSLITSPCLLVSMPSLNDSNFSKSVILLIEHAEDAAMGLVVNRPSSLSLKNMIQFEERGIPDEIPAWYGGPVDTTSGIILHNQIKNNGDQEIAEKICLSSTKQTLNDLIDFAEHRVKELRQNTSTEQRPPVSYPYRFIVGYAGWGAGQLDEELRAGAWLQQPLDHTILFETPWHAMWEQCFSKAGTLANKITSANQPYLN